MRASIPALLALTIGCATGAVMRDVVAPARAEGQTGASYEYDVAVPGGSIEDCKKVLAQYGRQGWRLSAVHTASLTTAFFFERQLAK